VNSRFQSVRVRTTVGAGAIVAITLALAGWLLVTALRSSQIESVDRNLELRALDIESLLDSGASPQTVAVESDEDGFVQILDGDRRVLASSGNIEGEDPIAVGPSDSTRTQRIPNLDERQFRVRNHLTDRDPQTTIVVGINLEDVEATGGFVRRALLVGLPLLLLTMAAMIWFVVGRALHPVEAIRREVAEIGGRDLDRRVPVPAARDEVGRLADTMNSMLDRLEEANDRQARFVSDASHELRTPIAVIRHELEIALRGDGSDWSEVASDVLEEDLRMQRLVDDLLLLARRDTDVAPHDLTTMPLVDLDDVALAEAHRVRSSKVVRTGGVSAGQVRGDPDQLGRVVRNLVDNALRHAASTVEIHLDAANGNVHLIVDDDGLGVDEPDRARIFERFGRADESRTRRHGGAGLGLAIVTELVAEHSGTIDVAESPQLGGARFTVTLPDARV
jgi:signal transduction histidine kinase